ncbi:MAG: ribonuclease III, partial [Planctomycetota bacterium]|nr:ribonuclease III [Planctomycetota bacterium]
MESNDNRLAQCQHVIGYFFTSQRLLETALTHSSLRSPDRECNERLEFLGDSVLGMTVTEELYHLLPDQSEGDLTRIKSAVVSRSALLETSQRLGLPRFAEFARGVGRRDKLPASVVANLVEAIIGAIYLDAGYYPAREFVLRHMGDALDDELNDRGAKNYKSLLQHEVQQSVGVTPTYRTVEAEGPDHAKEFVVAAIIRGQEWGRASGSTKKEAEQEAASLALEAWSRRGRGRRRRRRRGAEPVDQGPDPVVMEDAIAATPAPREAARAPTAAAPARVVPADDAEDQDADGAPRRRLRRRRRR